MVVQHNLTAMNSNRMLGLTTAAQSQSTERLSSGYKINRAADDAAGLAISEKMRKQIRGLSQASANAQDGISSVQTAEGALNEVQDMLQRMNELAVKASNGTNSESDRKYIQDEIDQLVVEIDRVSTTTKFNETYLLKGENADGTAAKLTYDTAKTNLSLDEFDDYSGKGASALTAVAAAGLGTTYATDGTIDGFSFDVGATTYNYFDLSTLTKPLDDGGNDVEISADAIKASYEKANATEKAFTNKEDFLAAVKNALNETGGDVKSISWGKDSADADAIVVETFADLNNNLDMSLHVGADSSGDNKIELSLGMMSARGLGVNGLRVDGDDYGNGTKAIDTITEALKRVSTQRSALGAVQNRLEHTINNLDNIVENTTAAESAIRDTDMATEMVKYSNNNILSQAGQAMLAQANQSNQGVLSLLG